MHQKLVTRTSYPYFSLTNYNDPTKYQTIIPAKLTQKAVLIFSKRVIAALEGTGRSPFAPLDEEGWATLLLLFFVPPGSTLGGVPEVDPGTRKTVSMI